MKPPNNEPPSAPQVRASHGLEGRKRSGNQKLARAAGVLIILLIFGPFLLESLSDIFETFGIRAEAVWTPLFRSAFWYQTVVKSGNRKPRDRYVRLITLVRTREPDDIFDNMCRQRLFMGKLLGRIETTSPAVIVIDKFFSQTSCPNLQDKGNQTFSEALRNTDTPIILGLRTSDAEELAAQKALTEAEKTGLRRGNLVLEPALRFAAGMNVKYGLIRGNRDTRKIPLFWKTFAHREDLVTDKEADLEPTLSKLAAEAFDPSIFTEPRLKNLLSTNTHPFTSFLAESEIPTFSAVGLVCDPNLPMPKDWENCQPGTLGENLFRNHVVIIGNRTVDDFKPSVIGTVPGVVLQANYIESLLDGRYFEPVNLALAILINAVVGAAIVWLFYRSIWRHTLSTDAALVWSLITVGLGWTLVYIIALQSGYYLVIWFPGLAGLVAIWAHSRAHEHVPVNPGPKPHPGG